ncbi:hypothetical protein CLOM_g13725, partial [Closterium sp. NIES-68]
LEFPAKGYPGVPGGPDPWEHADAYPDLQSAGTGGSGASVDAGQRQIPQFFGRRVTQERLRHALIELFADAALPFRLVDRPSKCSAPVSASLATCSRSRA